MTDEREPELTPEPTPEPAQPAAADGDDAAKEGEAQEGDKAPA
jgi:hypothetical protein